MNDAGLLSITCAYKIDVDDRTVCSHSTPKEARRGQVAPTELRMEKQRFLPLNLDYLLRYTFRGITASICFSKEAKSGDWKQFHPASGISKESSGKPEDDESHEGI